MANQDNKSFVDTMVDAQKEIVNSVVENTRKFTNGNAAVNETVAKGTEWYNNWLENQKNVFGQTTAKATDAVNNVQDNTQRMNEFYQNWYNTQLNTAKQMWESNQNILKGFQPNTSSNPLEAMTQQWNNWTSNMNNMNSWMGNMNTANNWMNGMSNNMQNMNPFNMMNNMKGATDNATSIFNQWYSILNNSFGDWQKNLENGTAQDAYRNMINTTEGFTRFYEMWMPMWKSIQEKSFNMDVYKQYINPAMYQEFMDKFFSFMPENARQSMQQMTEGMKNNMQNMGGQMFNGLQQFRGMMNNVPGMNGSEMFTNMLNMYTNMQEMMQQAASPITRMMPQNDKTKKMMEWQDIANRAMVYHIKNAEMQYMVYNQGSKVMDQLAENVMNKIQHGEEINSMMTLYQEWMNISDKSFVSLFESDDYSKTMAEVSAMQLKLRKDMETQMEGMMTGIPVATRSEMDELYKTIYDLKKEVRQLEKMMEMESVEEEVAPAATTTAKAAGRTKK
jgi:hypothetical protein